jgi:hypothetical protein
MGTRGKGQYVRRRLAALCVLTLVLVGLSTAYVAWRAARTRPAPPPKPQPTGAANALDEILGGPHLVFLDTPDYSHRHVAVASIDDPEHRHVTDTTCERVYASRAGGLCLGVEGTVAYSYNARSFDARLQPGASFELQGIPSRVRVSSDARYGSATVFVAGDSYGAPFSTRTVLFDLNAGHDTGSLEDFSVLRDGVRFESPDFNFSGARHFRRRAIASMPGLAIRRISSRAIWITVKRMCRARTSNVRRCRLTGPALRSRSGSTTYLATGDWQCSI